MTASKLKIFSCIAMRIYVLFKCFWGQKLCWPPSQAFGRGHGPRAPPLIRQWTEAPPTATTEPRVGPKCQIQVTAQTTAKRCQGSVVIIYTLLGSWTCGHRRAELVTSVDYDMHATCERVAWWEYRPQGWYWELPFCK